MSNNKHASRIPRNYPVFAARHENRPTRNATRIKRAAMKSYIIPSVQIRIHVESQQYLEVNKVQFSRSSHVILYAGWMPLGWFVSRVENSPDRQTGPSNAPWASYHPNTWQCTPDSKKRLGEQVRLVLFV